MSYIKALIALCIVCTNNNVMAAEWSVNSNLDAYVQHDDNVYLSSENATSATSGNFSPSLNLQYAEPEETFKSELNLSITDYAEHPELKREEGAFGIEWLKKFEHSDFQINSKYKLDSSLNSELDFSGISEQQVDRETIFFKWAWTYKFSESDGFNLSMSYSDVVYDEPGFNNFEYIKAINFLNYKQVSTNATYYKDITESNRFSLTINHTDYAGEGNGLLFVGMAPLNIGPLADEISKDYKYDVVKLEYVYKMSPTSIINFSIGANQVDVKEERSTFLIDQRTGVNYGSQGVTESNSSKSGQEYGFGYVFNQSNAKFSFDMSQGKDTDSVGGVVDIQALDINYSYRSSERLLFNTSLNLEKRETEESVSNTSSNTDRDRLSVTQQINWSVSKNIIFSTSYRYTKLTENLEIGSNVGDSNVIYLGINWSFDKLATTY